MERPGPDRPKYDFDRDAELLRTMKTDPGYRRRTSSSTAEHWQFVLSTAAVVVIVTAAALVALLA